MPMAVPGDPVENERILKRRAESLVAWEAERLKPRTKKKAAPRKTIWRPKRDKNAYERTRYATNPISRAKKRLRGMMAEYRRYQWAIKWELALPRFIAKALSESESATKAGPTTPSTTTKSATSPAPNIVKTKQNGAVNAVDAR